MNRYMTALAFLTILPFCGPKPEKAFKIDTAALEQAAYHISAEAIMEGTRILSADDMEGRGTGTPGERKAAEWIAGKFKEYGLKPMGEDYFQKVSLVGFLKDPATSSLTIIGPDGDIGYTNEETLTWWSTSQKETLVLQDAELLFVGYGVEAPEYGWDDYKGVDCKGKILVFLNNDPQTEDNQMFGGEARTYYGRYTYKFEQAMAKGAAGAVMIHTTPSAGYGWSVIGKSGLRERFALDLPGSGYQVDLLAWMHEDLAGQLAAVDATLDGWFEAANRKDFQPVPLPVRMTTTINTTLRKTEALNVAGYVEGADPDLKDEFIVFTAHYDHIGKLDHEGDTIYNGAWDNAAGTAAIIEIGHAFAKAEVKPRRSIAILACTAEEKGTLGSQWFVAQPPVPKNKLVGNINVDMPQIFGTTRDMVALGHDTNSLGDLLHAVAVETMLPEPGETLAIKGDSDPNAGSFYRSDQVNFAKAGIVALYANPGEDYLTQPGFDIHEYHDTHYHQAIDEINDHWNLEGCVRDMQVLFRVAARAANADQMPRWHAGNEFEHAWKQLYGQQ